MFFVLRKLTGKTPRIWIEVHPLPSPYLLGKNFLGGSNFLEVGYLYDFSLFFLKFENKKKRSVVTGDALSPERNSAMFSDTFWVRSMSFLYIPKIELI